MIPAKYMFPEGTTTAELLAQIAALKQPLTAAGWNESEHPREPKGSERGGQWRSILESESSQLLREVAVHNDDAAHMARTILKERGEPELTTAERWDTARKQMDEQNAQLRQMWQTDTRANDFYSDPYRAWADGQFGNGGDATLSDDWQKGWTWGEDALDADRAIYEQPPLTEDIAVWRGAYNEQGKPSSRPISTSFEKRVAGSYADRTGRGNEEHLHRVLIPAGSHVGWLPAESEIVLPTGTSLEPAGPNMWIARVPEQMVDQGTLRSSAWDESEHPRVPGGEADGGQFTTRNSYEGVHDAPDRSSGAPMSDLANPETGVFPEDIYGPDGARYYAHFPEFDEESLREIRRVRGNPDAKVTVYRAVPPVAQDINPGDWVTPSRSYAQEHAAGEDGWKILSKEVRAGDLYTDGNSIHEFGWDPSS